MVSEEYAIAYKEVNEILKYIPKDDYEKIPKVKINLFETLSKKDYEFTYNPDLTLDEQNVSRRAKAIIAILFRDYWATEEQRKKIISRQNYERNLIEEEKRKKYDPNNIFKNNVEEKIESDTSAEDVATSPLPSIKKETFFDKFLNFFKNLFK